jgi:hypothetical protein
VGGKRCQVGVNHIIPSGVRREEQAEQQSANGCGKKGWGLWSRWPSRSWWLSAPNDLQDGHRHGFCRRSNGISVLSDRYRTARCSGVHRWSQRTPLVSLRPVGGRRGAGGGRGV